MVKTLARITRWFAYSFDIECSNCDTKTHIYCRYFYDKEHAKQGLAKRLEQVNKTFILLQNLIPECTFEIVSPKVFEYFLIA